MVKKILFYTCFIFLTGMIIIQLGDIFSLGIARTISLNKSAIPTFSFITTRNKSFTNQDIDLTKPLIIMYMDPNCESCIAMTDQIFKYINEFQNCHLLMVSEADPEQINGFSTKYEIDKHQNIDIVWDPDEQIYNFFGLIETPSFVVYASGNRHIQTIDEFVSFPILIKYVRKATSQSS